MARSEDLAQTFIIPDDTLQRAMSEQPVVTPSPAYPVEANFASNLPAEQEGHSKLRGLYKAVAGAALTGYLLFGGGQQAQAEAAPIDTISNQTPSPEPSESNNNWILYGSLGITAAGLVASTVLSARSISRQSRESTEDRFNAALQAIKGESSGEERVLRIGDLQAYAERKGYEQKIFRAALTYLRGRRGGLEIMRREHKDDASALEVAITERRNADREALKLLAATLPKARKQLRKPGAAIVKRIKRLAGADDLYELDKLTGVVSYEDKPRVNARGVNIDFMRGVKGYSFRDTDLTGAGMQGNQFARVIFRNARLSEAQFEGSSLYRCSLVKTDARAVYWYGAEIKECVIDKHTKLGNLPDSHPDAKFGSLKPEAPDSYRGNPEVVLKDLIPAKGMSKQQLIEVIHEWQKNGLKLVGDSNPEYFYDPTPPATPQSPKS